MNSIGVGVGVIIIKDSKVLVGKRLSNHGFGTWSFPGGHMEPFEELFDTAIRETYEEAGIRICDLRKLTFTVDIHEAEHKHYVTLFVVSKWKSGNPAVKETDKITSWQWVGYDNIPNPLFLPLLHLKEEIPNLNDYLSKL
jgi:8-oxo-dGTP diphosphatase